MNVLAGYPHSVSKTFSNIELFLISPYDSNKPVNKCASKACKKLLSEINSAQNSIDMALYGFGDIKEIFDALKNAEARGVKIRGVVDYGKNMFYIYPDTKKFIETFDVKTDSNEILMHNKFFIFDDTKIMTGSANISASGINGYNSNVMVFINSKSAALIFKDEFEQMFKGKFSNSKKKFEKNLIKSADSVMQIYFSPKDDIYNTLILPEIKNAKSEIFVSAFYFTDRKMISELINAKKRGVNVMVLMDALGAINFKDRISSLRKENIPVVAENWGGKNHEKSIVIDSSILIVGSCNFSSAGFHKNDENMIKITNAEIASFYRDYYLKLFNSIDKKYLKLIPRSESFESVNSCYDGIDNNFDGKIDTMDDGCKPQIKK